MCRDHGFLVIKQTLAFVYLDDLSYQSRSKHFVLVTMCIQILVSSVAIGPGRPHWSVPAAHWAHDGSGAADPVLSGGQ